MYNLNSETDKDIADNHKTIQHHGGNMDEAREDHARTQDKLHDGGRDDGANGQMQADSVERYRRQVVKTLYLLAGVGVMGGSIYHLIK